METVNHMDAEWICWNRFWSVTKYSSLLQGQNLFMLTLLYNASFSIVLIHILFSLLNISEIHLTVMLQALLFTFSELAFLIGSKKKKSLKDQCFKCWDPQHGLQCIFPDIWKLTWCSSDLVKAFKNTLLIKRITHICFNILVGRTKDCQWFTIHSFDYCGVTYLKLTTLLKKEEEICVCFWHNTL